MRLLLPLAFYLALCPAATGFAQDKPNASEMAAARTLFNKGVEAAKAESWQDALGYFKKSYAVAEVPVTLYNIANAQEETGKLVAASETYHAFLGLPTSRRTRKYRKLAESSIKKIEARLSHVDIQIDGLKAQDIIRVDDAEISRAALGVPVPLDPGSHTLAVERGDDIVLSEDFESAEGKSVKLDLAVVEKEKPFVSKVPVDTEEPDYLSYDDAPKKESNSVFKKPLFWIIVGAVIAGGVVAAVLLTRDRSPDLFTGNFGPGMTTVD